MVDGEEGSSERFLKWGGGGPLRDFSKNILKQGEVDGETGSSERCLKWGGGRWGVIKRSF